MTDRKRFWISVASVLVLVVLSLGVDWAGGTGWQRVIGILLLVAIIGNLGAAILAWRRMRE